MLGGRTLREDSNHLHMRAVSIPTLERWIENEKFNLDHKAEGEYSQSTAILVVLNPNNQGTGLKCAGIGLNVRRRNGQVGQIEDISKLIAYAHSQLQGDRPPSGCARQTFCIIVGDYGGSMGFATDPPFCTTYLLSFANEEDPAWMTFWNPQNQPASFHADVLLVHQLLVRDCSPCEYVENKHNRHLIIPRGLHFSSDLFPQIVIPHDHTAPYRDPRTGMEAPLFTVGPFASTDMLFPSAPGYLDLFTNEEVYTLARSGSVKSPITGTPNLNIPTPASRIEPGSSTRKRSHKDSPKCKRPVSLAVGSLEDLGKLEYERAAELNRITGDGCSMALKHGISVDRGFSGERPHPKE